MPIIDDVAPDRAFYRSGETARISVRIINNRPEPVIATLRLRLDHLGETVGETSVEVTLEGEHEAPFAASPGAEDAGLSEISPLEAGSTAGPQHVPTSPSHLEGAYQGERGVFSAGRKTPPMSISETMLTLTPPPIPLRGYGLDADLITSDGTILASGSGALDVLTRWSDAPRYGFLSDFGPDLAPASIAARAASLNRVHRNVVQFYDWMWRHYRLLPPAPDFTDALGRRLSLDSVRRSIDAVHAHGAAALAYGAVYGAEPEFAEIHPELALFDDTGQRISLAELFYIMNIAPEWSWVPLIVAEFAAAVRELGFDGLHLDQYGFPKTAITAGGERVDLADHFPPLIEAARAAVRHERHDAGVIFNAVGNWPIETVAPTSQDATYIEVWPPDETYNDLRRLIREAKRLGGKPVILAAYLSPFLDAAPEDLAGAEAAALFATAVIAASGGSHLLLGEDNGILCDPYYPKYAALRPSFVPMIRTYYDTLVRYEELLVAPDVTDWDDAPLNLGGAPATSEAAAGAIWLIPRYTTDYRIVHLINLADQSDIAWNTRRTPPSPLSHLTLTVAGASRALWLTPDAGHGRPLTLAGSHGAFRLPPLRTWAMMAWPALRNSSGSIDLLA